MEVFFGGPEFGDLYHAAAFVAISSEHRVTIVPNVGDNAKWQPTRDFLDKISPGSTRICQHKGNAEDIGHTANVFHQQRHTNLPGMVSSKLTPLLNTECRTIHEHAAQLVTQKKPTCLFWIRHGSHRPERNLTELAYRQLACVLQEAGIHPILVGDVAPYVDHDDHNLLNFFKNPPFKDNPLGQLQLLSRVCENSQVAFSIGMISGAMDGLAFARGLRTYYVCHPRGNGRMGKVAKAFPAFSHLPVEYDDKFLQFSDAELARIYSRIS